MKTIVALVLSVIMTFGGNLHAIQDKIGMDKVAHASASYVLVDELESMGMSEIPASVITFAVGLAKEYLVDPYVDPGDLIADATGIGLHALKPEKIKKMKEWLIVRHPEIFIKG